MKISVRVRGEWFVIPCSDRSFTITWLAEDAFKRYVNFQSNDSTADKDQNIFKDFIVRKVFGGAILDLNDKISDVLVDNDSVYIGK